VGVLRRTPTFQLAFLFDDDDRILAHPKMSEMPEERFRTPFLAFARQPEHLNDQTA
jgi:hypothetical protein